jgi:hypothetical protein
MRAATGLLLSRFIKLTVNCAATVKLLFGKDTFYLFGGTVTVVPQDKNNKLKISCGKLSSLGLSADCFLNCPWFPLNLSSLC